MVTFFLPQRRLPLFFKGTVGVELEVFVVEPTVEEVELAEVKKLTRFDGGVTLTFTLKLLL